MQAPTPHTLPLPAYFGQFSQQCGPLNHQLLGNGFQGSLRPQESAHAGRTITHYQTYPERPPGADLHPQKVNNLDPMAPRSRRIPSEHPPPQKFANDGSFLDQMKRQLAAASRIQTAWRNRAAPTPPGEPVNDLRLALEAHSELKAHEARSSATRKPLRPRN